MTKLTAKERLIQRAKDAAQKIEVNKKKSSEVTVTSLEVTPPFKKFNLNLSTEKVINDFLNEHSDKLYLNEIKSNIIAGEILTRVYDELAGSNRYDGLYLEWLRAIEYSPRTALRHRIRYNLFHAAKTNIGKELFATLPVRLLDKLNVHNEKDHFISLINNSDIKSKDELEAFMENETPKEVNEKIKPVTPFYRPIFTYEKTLKKMDVVESRKALRELEDAEKEIKRLKKIIIQKEEEATL